MVRVRWCDRGGFWISSWLLVWLGVSCCVGVFVGFGAPCGFGGVRAIKRYSESCRIIECELISEKLYFGIFVRYRRIPIVVVYRPR